MTRDEILNMPAGRELDALVAEKVFGYKWVDTKDMYNHPVHALVPEDWNFAQTNGCGSDHECDLWAVGFYSTDIAAAWEVIEYLAGNSVELEVARDNIERFSVSHDSDGWCCNVWWFKNTQSSHAVEGIYAETAPLAICRAALLAVQDA